jgi:glucose-6-phosphate isomerase
MLSEGVNVNVTLLFSVEQYAKVCDAFIAALGRRHAEGKSLDVHSVASFFVSRVDTEVDKRLEALGREDLAGQAGLANARNAYRKFKEVFRGERFAELAAAGAPVQRPLWASTGVKNPSYPETMYVDELVGPDTVNTMPMATLMAAAEKSEVTTVTVDQDPTPVLDALREAGIDLVDVTDQLLREGIDAFVTPMEKLLAGIESKREAIVTSRPPTIDSSIPDELEGPIAARIKAGQEADVARRIWHKDDTLWGAPGAPETADRLGWLTIADRMEEQIPALIALCDEVRADGLTEVVLLGMGGSSLAPEVFRRSFGRPLHVLDTTDADAVRAAPTEGAVYVVSSKSGGTIETLSAFKHFWEQTGHDGSRFIAVTDPGTSLESLAAELGFRRCFANDPDIGGRYSALSYFGLVPAALIGADVQALVDGARVAAENCNAFDSTSNNSGLWLGLTLGELALQGRDKLTFVVDEPISSFGLWAEQLVAESTGKQGKGILPVADEPVGSPDSYGSDRVFAYLRNEGDHDEEVEALRQAGQPVITLATTGAADLGRVMFFAMFATAVAGWVLEINPFDQPNVQSAKDKTMEVLSGGAPDLEPSTDEALRALLESGPPSYLAIQGFLPPSDAFDEQIARARAAIRDATKMTTTFGYGPRYLHSTGQFHKGGPPVGRFLQLVSEASEDVAIPGEAFTFEALKRAQADGDLLALRELGRPVERIVVSGDPSAALDRIKEIL